MNPMTQQTKPLKEIWEIYNVGDFIDAKDNQGDWRMGLIVEKNVANRNFKVRFDGWEAKYDENYRFNSPKLAHFRSIVTGYTGKKKFPATRPDWKFNIKTHREKMESFRQHLNWKQKSAWEVNQFYRGQNYIYVDFLMTQTYESVESISQVIDYFNANIKMVIGYLKSIDPEFTKYYRSHEFPEQNHLIDTESAMANAFYEIMDTLYIISGSYSRLECFFNKNASVIRNYLQVDFEKNAKRYYQLRILEKVMEEGVFDVINQLVNQKLANAKNFIPLLFLKSLVSLYVGLSNQIPFNEKKPYLDKLVEITKNNMNKLNEKNLKDIVKTHFCDLIDALKIPYENTEDQQNIKAWALEQQVRLYIKMVECPYFDKKLKGVIGFLELVQKNKAQPQSNIFVDTLLRFKVFDCLFSSDNAEIIKKSVEFCKSLCYSDMFPYDIAFRIWELRQGKHQVALQEMYSLISALPTKYNPTGFEGKLFNVISQQPKEQWDEDYIKMIKEYSLTAIGWTNVDKQYKFGFDILLQNAITKKTDFAINNFIMLLHRFEKTEVMSDFINNCFQRIEENNDSYIHIIFLLRIIEDNLSNFRDVSQNASSIVVNDLLRNCDDSLERNTKRFQLLSQLTRITETCVTFEEFMSLWEKFKNKQSSKALYDWVLTKKQGQRSMINVRISSDIRRKIFQQLWNADYDFTKLSEKQCQILIEFFKNTNYLAGKLKRINFIIKIQTLDLIGLDKIWRAFETVENLQIASTLAELIVEVHMCPSKNLEDHKQEWTRILISKCSKRISEFYNHKQVSKVNRLLLIPSKIIDRDEEIFTTQPSYNIMKQYKVYNLNTREQKFIKFSIEGMCYDFKKLVAERFRVPLQRCRLSCKGQLIKYENYFKHLSDCSCGNTPFELEIIEGEIPSVKKLLNNQLELFFNLLGDVQLEKSVWEIIERLPIAEDFLAKVQESSKPWEDINSTSIYKQLYIMRVMGYMRDKWWYNFLSGPGLFNLTKKFGKFFVKTKVQRQYLKTLCQNIERCFEVNPSLQGIDLENLVLQMFKALNQLLDCIGDQKIAKKGSVEVTIISSIFKIFEHFSNKINILSILIQKFNEKVQFLTKGLVTNRSDVIRADFTLKMKSLGCNLSEEQTYTYLNILFKIIFTTATSPEYKSQTTSYFSYASYIVYRVDRKVFQNYLQKTDYQIVNQVERRLFMEKAEKNPETINYQLVGFLNLAKALVTFCPEEQKQRFCDFLLNKCFFPHLTGSNEDLLCKSLTSKRFGFGLMYVLIIDSRSSEHILSTLSEFHKNGQWRTRKIDDWALTPGEKLKSPSGYVGLKNLGCICYMNSFFQQMFMIPDFRQAILECDDPLENKENPLENVLYQVKKMFFSLIHSEKKYYIPNEFCASFKNYQGQPTNVFEQMDIDEFSGILFDRLENQMKGTPYENIIKGFFGGVFSNEIICKGCPHFSETQESFLSIGLSVKGKKNIYQSLDTMIKGDTLDGDNAYFCERCNKKVSAVKRVCLKKLPDHLILTLKRFEFDFETMNKVKVNDYCEFPTQLNVKQYSQQYLRKQQNPDRFEDEQTVPDSYYDYTLQGVVIHIGHADSGHYYSFIRERKDDGKWFQFNDTIVRPFDIKKLAEEAFGGEMGTTDIKQKIKNAYMLIYERKKKMNNFDNLIHPDRNMAQIPIYNNLLVQIQKANTLQKIESILFSSEYTKFAEDLIKSVSNIDVNCSKQIVKFVVLFYLTVTIRQKEQSQAFDFLKLLQNQLTKFPEIRQWVLRIFTAQKSLIEFLKNNPAKEVRKLLAFWIFELAKYSTSDNKKLLVDNLLAYIVTNNENLEQINQILYCLLKETEICEYFIEKHGAGILLESFYGTRKPVFKTLQDLNVIESAEQEIGNEVFIEKTSFEMKKSKGYQDSPYFWAVLSQVVDYAERKDTHIMEILPKHEYELFLIPGQKSSPNKLYKILEEMKTKLMINKFTKIMVHLSKVDLKYCKELINMVFMGIKDFQSKRYRQFYILLKNILKINDEHQPQRIKDGLDCLIAGLKQNEKYPFDCNVIQQWIMKILHKNPELQQRLLSKAQSQKLEYLLSQVGKKIPTQQNFKKNCGFQQTTVNKFHGIKLPRNRKGYEKLNARLQKFFQDLTNHNLEPPLEWDSDEDLTDSQLRIGNNIVYFDNKDKIQFVPALIDDIFLHSLNISTLKSKGIRVWQQDQRLASQNCPLEEVESDSEAPDSDNTTEMEYQEDQP